jgi:hypothetical protein
MNRNGTIAARLILPTCSIIALIALIEVAIAIGLHPTFWEKSTWLLHDPYRDEPLDRLVVYKEAR